MRALGAPGASVTVMKDGRVVWSEGFGWADVEQQVPVTALTRFRAGSVAKPLTAAALALLVQEGKVDLDAPVQRYVPGFPTKRWPITVRQVAGHVAGIRHYRGDEFLNQRPYATVAEGLTIFRDDSLLFEPGTRYAYSSYGYNLIAAVIEGASGLPYLRVMRERVFGPAGLRHTVAEHPDSLIPYRARFYTRRDAAGGIVNAPYVDNSYKWAGGGFLSTTEDLARFGQAMLDGTLLRPPTTELLWTSQRTRDGKPTDYGIGWSTGRDAAGRRRVAHSGGSVGGTAYLLLYPDQKLVVAVLVNSDRTFVGATPRIGEEFLK
jgi:CubicO group peptidase (beta-lactamase class C family)